MDEFDYETFEEFQDEYGCDSLNFCVAVRKPDKIVNCWVFYVAQTRKERINVISVGKASKKEVEKYLKASKKIFLEEIAL